MASAAGTNSSSVLLTVRSRTMVTVRTSSVGLVSARTRLAISRKARTVTFVFIEPPLVSYNCRCHIQLGCSQPVSPDGAQSHHHRQRGPGQCCRYALASCDGSPQCAANSHASL